jgi:hypothetical protein
VPSYLMEVSYSRCMEEVAEGEQPMYPRRMVRQALGLGLLMTLVVLAMSACGSAGQEDGGSDSSEPRATNLEGKILFTRERG